MLNLYIQYKKATKEKKRMTKTPAILKMLAKGKVNKLFSTADIAIKQLEKAKQQGLIPKEKVDSWIKDLKQRKEAAKEEQDVLEE